MSDEKILVIGKDEKMSACRDGLEKAGFSADCVDTETVKSGEIRKYKNIILPLPTVKNGFVSGTGLSLGDFCACLSQDSRVFCGNISESEFPCRAYSYCADEDFLLKNSRLTAQGTLRLILENVRKDICGMTAAVTGYGRCGREICRLLKNCGLEVTSFSRRRETLSAAKNSGFSSSDIENIGKEMKNFDITVNTVPFNIISADCLKNLTQDNTYIEIASEPYGFDASQADKYDFRYIYAGGLPGRFTPVSAGINIAETILSKLKE